MSAGAPAGPGFAEVFAALPVAALVVDQAERVVHANAAAEALINVSERAMLGQPLAQILTLPNDYRLRRDERDFAAYDSWIELARGGRIRADFIETQFPDRPGWRIMTFYSAPTARRVSAADRATARAAVGAAAMLAHEIKNPLSGIRGAAQLLAGNGPENGDLTTLITSEVDRIAALIDRMQDFTDTRPLDISPHNVYPLIDHARSVALAGFARDIAFEERFDPSLPSALLSRDAILQVLLNLLKNAAEATLRQADRRIILATAYRHGMAVSGGPGKPRRPLPIEICVIDNGPGAPSDIADHLFDPFVSGKPEGQGLGLTLAEKLMRDMGGIVQYERDAARSQTVFRLLLPRAGN